MLIYVNLYAMEGNDYSKIRITYIHQIVTVYKYVCLRNLKLFSLQYMPLSRYTHYIRTFLCSNLIKPEGETVYSQKRRGGR